MNKTLIKSETLTNDYDRHLPALIYFTSEIGMSKNQANSFTDYIMKKSQVTWSE